MTGYAGRRKPYRLAGWDQGFTQGLVPKTTSEATSPAVWEKSETM